jgi:hypothetical protein
VPGHYVGALIPVGLDRDNGALIYYRNNYSLIPWKTGYQRNIRIIDHANTSADEKIPGYARQVPVKSLTMVIL